MSATAGDAPQPWYERLPERWEWELACFGDPYGLVAEPRMGLADGRLPGCRVVRTELPFRGEQVPIEVSFPFDYPDVGPTIYGPLGLLDRHQTPTGGNFCWAEDHDRDWSTAYSAAYIVHHQIRWLLEDSEAGDEVVAANEAPMAEPLTGLVSYRNAIVVVPYPFLAESLTASEGRLTLRAQPPQVVLDKASGIGVADPRTAKTFTAECDADDGYWLALSPPFDPPRIQNDPVGLADEIAPRFRKRIRQRLKEKKSAPYLDTWLGFTFLEQGPTVGEVRRNWLFARVRMYRDGRDEVLQRLSAQAFTLDERQRRTPELVGLAAARVLIIGAGSVGSPLAHELAKAGAGYVDIVDKDIYDVNNSVRHVLAVQAAGLGKASAVALIARGLNPFVEIAEHGDVEVGGGERHTVALLALIAEADLVVDTTGSVAAARILQRHCHESGTTLIVGGLTAGSYGADIAICYPGGACIECFELAQHDGIVPRPQAAPPSTLVTPIGCTHPAFAGAGFDATALAAALARVIVQTSGCSSYPALDADWIVMNFRGEPAWTHGRLDPDPRCSRCQSR